MCKNKFPLYRLGIYFGFIEGFDTKNKWSKETMNQFIELNDTLYQGLFNLDILQCQVTEEEAKEFLKTGVWPWLPETKEKYMDILKKNTILRTDMHWTMNEAMQTYNNMAMQELIKWNSPEGKFLLEGRIIPGTAHIYGGNGTYGLNSGLETLNQDLIRCDANGKMARYTNYANYKSHRTEINYEELPKLLPGFSWQGEPCNPCENLDYSTKNKCKFTIPPTKKALVVATNEEKIPWTISWY